MIGLTQEITTLKQTYSKILQIDKEIRFVGRIKGRKLLSFVRRANSKPLVDEELGNLSHYQVSVKASMESVFDEALGKTDWMITAREKVKLITIFLDDGLLILSTEPKADHDKIINGIKSLNDKL